MEHTIALIQKSHQGDKEAREQLIKENAGLVWCVAKRFYGRGTEAEDLFQIGNIGLLKAIDKFAISYEVKFSTYAVPLISGEIKRFLRDDGMIKVSRSLKSTAAQAFQAKEILREKLGREPDIQEISDYLKIDREDLVLAMDAQVEVESLHRPVYQKDGNEVSLLEKLPQEEGTEEKVVERILLAELLETLDKEERQLIYLRYFAEKTQSATGKQLGISQVQVSRMEKRILEKLRRKL